MGSKHNKAFGEELRFRRDEHGLSQEEVAWRAHLSRQYVSRLELGECSPSLDTWSPLLPRLVPLSTS